MANQWFKFWGGEYLADPKMLQLSADERSCWITLLCYASLTGGVIEHLSFQRLMVQSGVDMSKVTDDNAAKLSSKLSNLQMITLDNEVITITNWKKRQGIVLTGYERVKRFREKQLFDNADNADDNIRIDKNRIDKNIILDHFVKFWDLYPRKVNKKKSFDIYRRVVTSDELAAKIIAALKNHIESEQWKTPQYIPHPTTWLNREGWDDEVIKAVKKPFYKGDPVIEKNGKKYVIVKGQWLEFAGRQADIEYK